MTVRDGTLKNWWTREEWSNDKRTGATARVIERDDRYHWIVFHKHVEVARGDSASQSGARGACRKVVRKIAT